MSDRTRRGVIPPVTADIEKKSDDEVKALLDQLIEDEQRVSYRRRVLHAQIDTIREELIRRLSGKKGTSILTNEDLDKLTEILARQGLGLPPKNVID